MNQMNRHQTFINMSSPKEESIDDTEEERPTMYLQSDGVLQHRMSDPQPDIDDFLSMLMEDTNKPNNVPQVKIKCEDEQINDYDQQTDGDCLLDEMSPFCNSGVSSPASSYGNMSAPGSPSMMMDQQAPPPYSQNYLTPESAMFAQNPSSPSSYSAGSQSPTYSSGGQSPTYSNGGQSPDTSYKYDPRPLGRKKRRNLVPDEKKTVEYWERRKRNNVAARRSREERRNKELQTFQHMKNLQQENCALKQTINMMMKNQQELQGEVTVLKQLLEQSFKV